MTINLTKSLLLSGLLVSAVSVAGAFETTPRRIRIQDLTAVAESGVKPEELRVEMLASSTATYPNSIITGNHPNTYVSGSSPNIVTQGNSPNFYNSGNYPDRYTMGRALGLEGEAEEIPMPNLNF